MTASDHECRVLCTAFFGVEPPEDVVVSYARAAATLNADAIQQAIIDTAILRGYDLQALELAWRRREQTNLLSGKAHALAFLLEAHPGTVALFVNNRPARLRAFPTLAWYASVSVWKLIRGTRLFRRLASEQG